MDSKTTVLATFDAICREDRGLGRNFVSLVTLRADLGAMSRREQDKALDALRGRELTLSAAEGRHGLSPQELQAGIREKDGTLLLFVSRRNVK